MSLIVLAAGCTTGAPPPSGRAAGGVGAGADSKAAGPAFGKLPLRFEANRGQVDADVDFLARGSGYTAFLTGEEAVLRLDGGPGAVVRMRLEGADPGSMARGLGPQTGESSYLSGPSETWVRSAPAYGKVGYRDLWPGIDGVYRGAANSLEYDFVAAPGADPSRITLGFGGDVTGVAVDDAGELVIDTPAGPVRHERPIAYQEAEGGRRTPVEARYLMTSDRHVRFELGRYDPAMPLVIDPVVVYSTFLGGALGDAVNGIAVDGAGNAYVAGVTSSPEFPAAGAFQTVKGPGNDAFVTKLDPSGTGLVYSTFLGGALADAANAIAVDGAGSAYITGTTTSPNFPVTAGTFTGTFVGFRCPTPGASTAPCTDAFVAKLNPAGNALVYSTFLGGTVNDAGNGIAVDAAGGATVVGTTTSIDFPVEGGLQAAFGEGLCATPAAADAPCTDAFVSRLSPNGSALTYSTYLGGEKADSATGVAVDAVGNAYVTGSTSSPNFPTTNPYQAAIGGGTCPTTPEPTAPCSDAFVTKLPPGGSPASYSTYLGGSSADSGSGIAVDAAGAAYLTGPTSSTSFPTAAALQATKGAGAESDAFVTKVAPSGSSLAYSTYLGGAEMDYGSAIAVDSTGSAHVSGVADSERFPVERPVARLGGNEEAFVARLHPSGGSLLHATHYGGIGAENGRAIAVDAASSTYVGGLTTSARRPEHFPIVNAFQPVSGGGAEPGPSSTGDGFVLKITPDTPGRPLVTRLTPRSGDSTGGSAVTIAGHGLKGATAVRFGDTPALSFVVESDQRIVAVSPPLAVGAHKVTVVTGGGTSPANPISEFWSGEGSWSLTGSLATPRSAHTSTLLSNGKVLVAGGRQSAAGGPLASAELYDPLSGTWQPTGSLAGARWSHSATLLPDGRVLVAGGFTTSTTTLRSAELYNPTTGTWAPAADMAASRGTFASVLLRGPSCGASCGKALVTGGRSWTGGTVTTLGSTELYDPQRNAWEPVGSLQQPRHLMEAVALPDGRVLVAGGFGPTSTAETFDPQTGAWTFTTNSMRVPRARATVTLMEDGNVLVNNGWDNGPVPSSDVFDHRTNSFRPAAAPLTHRWNATAVTLPDGRVLALAGGVGGATAEVYDPRLDSFSSAGLMQVARGASSLSPAGTGGTAVVLSSGKVLVVGNTDDPVTELYTPAARRPGPGYWLTGSDGGIFAFGSAGFHGSTGRTPLNRPVVGMAATPSGDGYWLVASDGGVFGFGDAEFHGSTGGVPLNRPVVGIASTPSGRGYWLVASDGGMFAYGDAAFHGSTGGLPLNRPVVAMSATPTGGGYWLTAEDGGIFAFGDAAFSGSTGGVPLNSPVVGMAATATGDGYWLVASDGGIFAFGDAPFLGSTGGVPLALPVVAMAAAPPRQRAGYWLLAADGGVFAFGGAPFLGSTGGVRLNRPMVAMAAAPAAPPP